MISVHRIHFVSMICLIILAYFLGQPVVQAEITTDGTMGPVASLSGPNYDISADLGQKVGSNLFHSFQAFSINAGESAAFTGPNTIENIISRVTGGTSSVIDGILRSEISGANLYFLNPAGVMFGPNASLDISGSFHVSTADYLRLEENGRFDASQLQNTVLTSAPPSAFGFMGENPASITVDGSGSTLMEDHGKSADITLLEGETFSIIGGKIDITSAVSSDNKSCIQAPGGRINIAAVASSGEVIPTATGLEVDSFTQLNEVVISGGPYISVSSQGAGNVYIRSGRLIIDGGSTVESVDRLAGLYATSTGDIDGGKIDIQLEKDLTISNGATICSDGFGTGSGRSISIEAENVIIETGGSISSTTNASGQGGSITINADKLEMRDGTKISSSSFGSGQGGDITINTSEEIRIVGNNSGQLGESGGITAKAEDTGNGGNININAENLTITDGAGLSTSSWGCGESGSISINVAENIRLAGKNGGPKDRSYIVAQANAEHENAGNGGNIDINAKNLDVLDAAMISTSTFGSGQGGDININVTENIQVSGDNSGGRRSCITAETKSVNQNIADGGSINIKANNLAVMDGAKISTVTINSGEGGDININVAGTIRVAGDNCGPKLRSAIKAGSFGNKTGNGGGTINIYADNLEVKDGSLISTSTLASGQGGSINIKVTDTFQVVGINDEGAHSSIEAVSYGRNGNAGNGGIIMIESNKFAITDGAEISSSTSGHGQGGEITLQVFTLDMGNNSLISAQSTGTGTAGNITINSSDAVNLNNSTITTGTLNADGGNMTINAANQLSLVDSDITTSVQGGQGNGGNISIDPEFVTLNNSRIIANACQGTGGNIHIAADYFFSSPESIVEASSHLGIDGTVHIDTYPDRDISGEIILLKKINWDEKPLLLDPCALRTAETSSSLIVTGRSGLPPKPDDFLSISGMLKFDY